MAVDLGTGYLEVRPKFDSSFERDAEKRLGTASSRLTKSMGKVGKGMTVGVTLPLIALGGVALKEAEEAEQVTRQVEATLKSTGNAAVISADQVDDIATSVSNLAAIDDEAVAGTSRLALSMIDFKSFGDQADETLGSVTQGIFDYAAATGKSEKAGAKVFASIVNTPKAAIGQLQKLGVVTEEEAERLRKMEERGEGAAVSQELLAAATERWAGSAEASATPSAKLQVTLANLAESFGSILSDVVLPAVEGLAGMFSRLTSFIENLSPAWKKVAVIAVGFVAALGPVLWVGSKVIGMVGKLVGAFAGVVKFISSSLLPMLAKLWAFMLANPFVAIAAAVVLLVILIIANWDKVKAFLLAAWGVIKRAAITVWNAIKQAILVPVRLVKALVIGYFKVLKAIVLGYWEGLKFAARTIWNAIKWAILTPINALKAVIKGVWNWIKDNARTAWNAVKDIITGVWEGIADGVRASINFLIGGINVLIDGLNTVIHGMNVINPFKDIPDIPPIPLLRHGGIVMADTLAVVHSGEVVAPLDRLEGMLGQRDARIVRGTLTLTPDSRAYVEAVIDDDSGSAARHSRTLRRMGVAG